MNRLQTSSNIKHVAQGWQSEGHTGTPWLGPDVQDLTRTLYNEHQYKHFIYTPVGFVCEHLEVLYDNDYECKVVCDEIEQITTVQQCLTRIHYLLMLSWMK